MLKSDGTYLFRKLFILCLVAGFCFGYAQQNNGSFLINQAQFQLDRDFAKAYTMAQKAYQQAVAGRDTSAMIESLCIINTVKANSNQERAALLQSNKALALTKNKPLEAGRLFSVKSLCYYTMSIYDSAQYASEKAIALFSAADATSLLAAEYNHLTKILLRTGNNTKACQLNDTVQRLLGRSSAPDEQAQCRDILAEIYLGQHLYDKGIEACRAAYTTFISTGNVSGMATALLHRANAYYMKVSDDSAKKYYSLAVHYFGQLKDTNGLAICYSNLSRIFLEAGNTTAAIEYANKALTSIANGNYCQIETATLQQLGDIYGALAQYKKAVAYVEKALLLARQYRQKVVERDCHKSLSEIYEAMHQPAQAFTHLLAAYRLKDSLQPITVNRQLAEMQARYESEKKEGQITLLRQSNYISTLEIEEQKDKISLRNMIILLGILVVFLIGLAVYFLRQKQKLKERLEREQAIEQTEEKERLRIAKDIHDELGSGLSKIKLLAELAAAPAAEKQRQHSALQSISETSRGLIDNMRELIWAMNPENTMLDSLVAHLREYSHDYLDQFPLEFTIDFPEEVPAQRILREVSRNVFMIVKESLQNIVKHAAATEVAIKLRLSEAELMLEISDNGKGFDPSKEASGNGLKNMKARSQVIGAALDLSSTPGNGSVLKLAVKL